ncbi:MAG: T9SS type A sorting domain-containing protein [Bacteroidales bacterium]|nr:T9SS type A sorting domain-containing protein [Bacteroidales bacterium]
MKKLLFSMILLLQLGVSKAQIVDDVYISTNFNSSCVIQVPDSCPPYLHSPGECFIVCRNSVVTYTAENVNAISYEWEVSGAESYDTLSDGKTIQVNWGNSEGGRVKVGITTSNGKYATDERCIQVIEQPKISVMSTPGYTVSTGTKVINLCFGETVSFTDISQSYDIPIESYTWIVEGGEYEDNNEVVNTKNYSMTPLNPGKYTVTHKIENACGCESEEVYIVHVSELIDLELSCYGTACGGRQVSYTLENISCSEYFWNVENGEIVSPQGLPTVTVVWDSPVTGYGVLSLDMSQCETDCNNMISRKIPVISEAAVIQGKSEVCIGESLRYELPLWGSTSYDWAVVEGENEDPATSVVMSSDLYPNQKIFTFTAPGTYTIRCLYRCNFLQCGPFVTTKTITVKDALEINSSSEALCAGVPVSFTTNSESSVWWGVYNKNGILQYTTTNDSLTYTFETPGTSYTIKAYDTAYCDTSIYSVAIRNNPPIVDSIVGDSVACPYEGTLLTAYPTSPRYYIEWYTYNDSTWHSGSSINVFPQFVNGEYCVGVCQVDIETGCRSELTNYTIHLFRFSPVVSDGFKACPEELLTLSVVDQAPRCLYEWYLDEDNYYKASVQGSHIQASVDLAINRLVSGGDDNYLFPVMLQRSACGVKTKDTVLIEVNHPAEFAINMKEAVCQNDALLLSAEGDGDDTYLWEIPGRMRREGNNISHTFNWSGIDTIEVSARSGATCSYGTPKIHIVEIIAKPQLSILSHGDGHLEAVVSNCDPIMYEWSKGDEVLSSEPMFYVENIESLTEYCCEVFCEYPEDELLCSARNCYSIVCEDTIDVDPVHIEDLEPYCGRGTFAIEPYYTDSEINWYVDPFESGIEGNGSSRVNIKFRTAGVHTITAIERKYDGHCVRHTITCTIYCVPHFTLSYICPDNIKITDSSSYYQTSIDNIAFYYKNELITVAERGGYWITSIPDEIDSKTTFAYRCEFGIIDNATGNIINCDAVTNPITLYPSGELLSCHIPQKACAKVPFSLYATGNNIMRYTWRFADNSTYSNDSIDHTVELDGSSTIGTINIKLTAIDSNGCTFSRNGTVEVRSNLIEGMVFVQSDPYPCPGNYSLLQFLSTISDNDNENDNMWTYRWLSGGEADTLPTYNTLVQDNHIVRVMEPEYGCVSEFGGKSIFRLAPDARILAKSVYCPEDEVRLLAAPGSDYTYQWNIGGYNMSLVDTVHNPEGTLTISGCTPMRDYYDTLIVGNSQGCYSTAYHNFKIVYTSASPQISIDGDNCMLHPPLRLISTQGIPLYWSNGDYGTDAYYYTSGSALAYYYDTNGCKSYTSNILLSYVPDYDALLTGCYCLSDYRLPTDLPIYGFYPQSTILGYWQWLKNDNSIHSGNSPIDMLPIEQDGGEYRLLTKLPDNIDCESESPLLTILKCGGEGGGDGTESPWSDFDFTTAGFMQLSLKEPPEVSCEVNDCELYVTITLNLLNRSEEDDETITDIFANSLNNTVVGFSPNPLYIVSGESETVTITMDINNISANSIFLYFFNTIDNKYFYISINDLDFIACAADTCVMNIVENKFELDIDRSTQGQALYFNFELEYPGVQDIFKVWVEPSEIINIITSSNTIAGIWQLNYNSLSNHWDLDNEATVCIHALVCKDSTTLCHAIYCVPISTILEMADGMLDEKSTKSKTENSDTSNIPIYADEPYLVPNPAYDNVSIEGMAKEDIEAVNILDMNGKAIPIIIRTNNINISNLPSGAYIVCITTSNNKVHYLKLIKK